ncbi:MAG: crossover junction endodeoxyribonuclease RuvC [Pseudobdellovibrionaceae bacterium]|jgi:crossover junction endodeoxyribonuclease RuvC
MIKELTLLGVDPGSRATGFGVIHWSPGRLKHVNHGVILLDPKNSFNQRISHLGSLFAEVLKRYQPHQVVIEKMFLGKNIDSAFKLGHARGVIISEAGRQGADIFEYSTRLVKKGITGSGASSKEQVQAHLQLLLGVSIQQLDASDALAMACFQTFYLQKQKLLERVKDQ